MKCCDITAGQLNIKTQIYRLIKVPDGAGGYTQDWELVFSPWARVKPKSGSEKLHSQRLNATGLASVVIRYSAGINETMKIFFKGRDHNIRSVVNIEEADEWLELLVERGVAQ